MSGLITWRGIAARALATCAMLLPMAPPGSAATRSPPGLPFTGAGAVAGGGSFAAYTGSAPGWVQVANRVHAPDNSANNANNFQSLNRLIYTLPNGASEISLCYAGWKLGPAEFALPSVVFSALYAVPVATGTGYAMNDIITLTQPAYATTPAGSYAPVRLRVGSVATGALGSVLIEQPGIYDSIPANAVAQASTTGSGASGTFTVVWQGFAQHIRAAVEPASSNGATSGTSAVRPVRWSGSVNAGTTGGIGNNTIAPALDLLIPPGKLICSDPVQITVPAGGQIAVRTFTDGPYTGFGDILSNAGDASGFGSPNATDNSQSGTITPQAASSAPSYGPALILGRPLTTPAAIFGSIGDSICWGTTGGNPSVDLGDASGNKGWFARAVGPTAPVASTCSASNQIAYLFNASYGRSAQFDYFARAGVTDIGEFLSVNDLRSAGGNVDLGNGVLANENRLAAELRALGVRRVFTSTNTPVTSTTAATSAAGTGTTATIGYNNSANYAIPVGSYVTISGETPSGYNTASSVVTASNCAAGACTVSYANATTGAQTVAGTVGPIPDAVCQRSAGSTWTVGGTQTNGIMIRNALLRQGLLTSGAYGPYWAATIGGSSVSSGAQTVTPSAMSGTVTSGGLSATVAILPGSVIVVNPGGGSQEIVKPTATNGTVNAQGYPTAYGSTFTATFANAHSAGEAIYVMSPYRYDATWNSGGFDFAVDFGTTLERSLGACVWTAANQTGDGLHPSYLTSTTGGHVTMATVAAPVIAANQ